MNAVKEAERRERARQAREREVSRQRAVFDRRKVQEVRDCPSFSFLCPFLFVSLYLCMCFERPFGRDLFSLA